MYNRMDIVVWTRTLFGETGNVYRNFVGNLLEGDHFEGQGNRKIILGES
jgi:hypothetical protein